MAFYGSFAHGLHSYSRKRCCRNGARVNGSLRADGITESGGFGSGDTVSRQASHRAITALTSIGRRDFSTSMLRFQLEQNSRAQGKRSEGKERTGLSIQIIAVIEPSGTGCNGRGEAPIYDPPAGDALADLKLPPLMSWRSLVADWRAPVSWRPRRSCYVVVRSPDVEFYRGTGLIIGVCHRALRF